MLSAVQMPTSLPRLGGSGRYTPATLGRPPSKRNRTPRQISLMDLSQMQTGGCTSSRVVMVRKTEQRTFKTGEEPKFETVTKETIETFRGNRSERITTSQKRDVFENVPGELRANLNFKNGCAGKPAPVVKAPSPRSSPDSAKTTNTKNMEEGDFATDCLRAHNEFRLKHGVPPLKLNRKLCKFSEEWAKRLATRGVMEHRQGCEYGENIFCVWNSSPSYKITGREPVDSWYSESKKHVYGREPTDLTSGHFTQVVWQDSKELGVAFAKSTKTGQIFVVANYSPPGNFIGSFTKNVSPIGGFPKDQRAEAKPSSVRTNKTSSSSDDDEEDFDKRALKIHNDYRKKHGVPEMELNKEMCRYARDWAALLIRDNKFCHRTNCQYGENLFNSWSSDPKHTVTAEDVCKSWYSEIKDFTFGVEPGWSSQSGHFTQMIWKASTELGIGMARGNGKVIVVANYNPRGNYVGQFAANCPRPR